MLKLITPYNELWRIMNSINMMMRRTTKRRIRVLGSLGHALFWKLDLQCIPYGEVDPCTNKILWATLWWLTLDHTITNTYLYIYYNYVYLFIQDFLQLNRLYRAQQTKKNWTCNQEKSSHIATDSASPCCARPQTSLFHPDLLRPRWPASHLVPRKYSYEIWAPETANHLFVYHKVE